MSYLDDKREKIWQVVWGSIPRIWHNLEKACVEWLGDGDIKPIGLNGAGAHSKGGFQI